jgi:hypothetical protein
MQNSSATFKEWLTMPMNSDGPPANITRSAPAITTIVTTMLVSDDAPDVFMVNTHGVYATLARD